MITFSESARSILQAPQIALHTDDTMDASNECYLHAITATFIAERVISTTPSTGVITVVFGDPLWMTALHLKVERRRKMIVFINSHATFEEQRTIFLHHSS